MPNWEQVLREVQGMGNPLDIVRRKYLKIMHKYTGRNIVAYYSGFLQKTESEYKVFIEDADKNAFMQVVNRLDKKKGLDLILHTPGGNTAATESIVNYLKSLFGNDVRAFIPQIAMSAGTMIALSCKEIVMGKQSSIGPIDPQFGGISCAGVIEEFTKAVEDIKKDPNTAVLWQPIISKYHPTFLGDCEKAIKWSNQMVLEWLKKNMLSQSENPDEDARKIVAKLGSHEETFSHSKHIHIDECKSLGIKVKELESFPKKKIGYCVDLQDCVLTIHHAFMQSFVQSQAVKIVENNIGAAMITTQVLR